MSETPLGRPFAHDSTCRVRADERNAVWAAVRSWPFAPESLEREDPRMLARRIPGATLQVFEGGHIFMVQDRTAFPAIIDFLRGDS